MEDIKEKEEIDLSKIDKRLEELNRRVNITYRARINAANRLREKQNNYRRLSMYYSALVTGLSIISMGIEKSFLGINISNIILTLSILLSYFMFYESGQNLQERAYKMEEKYRELGKLRNKIDLVLIDNSKKDMKICKKLYREYEDNLNSIENHEKIDYMMVKLEIFKKGEMLNDSKDIEIMQKYINRYNFIKRIKNFSFYIVPIILIISICFYLK